MNPLCYFADIAEMGQRHCHDVCVWQRIFEMQFNKNGGVYGRAHTRRISNVIPHWVSRRHGIELLEKMYFTSHRRRLKSKSNDIWLKARKKLVMVEYMDCQDIPPEDKWYRGRTVTVKISDGCSEEYVLRYGVWCRYSRSRAYHGVSWTIAIMTTCDIVPMSKSAAFLMDLESSGLRKPGPNCENGVPARE